MSIDIFQGAAAIITGGASGLGAATACKLAKQGLKPCLFDINNEAGTRLAQEIGASFYHVDISDAASVAQGIEEAEKHHGIARLLVNCAGIGGAAKTVSRGQAHDPALFAKIINVNLIGCFNMASQIAARMVTAEPLDQDGSRGVIINTSSIAAFEGQVGQLAYAASKGGIASMTLPMARDLADKGIRVCTIAPGLFQTPLMDELPEEVQASLGAQVPFPSRLGKADEFASLACHIIENSMFNGENIRLDGAIRMRPR